MSEFIKAVVTNANDEEFNKRGGRASMAAFYQKQIEDERSRPVPPSDALLSMFQNVVTLVSTCGSWNDVIIAVAKTMVALADESKEYREGAYDEIQKMLSESAYEQMVWYFESTNSMSDLCASLKQTRNFLYYN